MERGGSPEAIETDQRIGLKGLRISIGDQSSYPQLLGDVIGQSAPEQISARHAADIAALHIKRTNVPPSRPAAELYASINGDGDAIAKTDATRKEREERVTNAVAGDISLVEAESKVELV